MSYNLQFRSSPQHGGSDRRTARPSVFQSGTSCTALNPLSSVVGTTECPFWNRQEKSFQQFSTLRVPLPLRLFEYPRAGFFNEVAPVVPKGFTFAGRMNYLGLTHTFVRVISEMDVQNTVGRKRKIRPTQKPAAAHVLSDCGPVKLFSPVVHSAQF